MIEDPQDAPVEPSAVEDIAPSTDQAPEPSLSTADLVAKAFDSVGDFDDAETPAPAEETPGRTRDERGRFAKAEGAEAPQEPPTEPAPVEANPQEKPAEAPPVDDTPGFLNSPEAKAAWAQTPEPVRKDIERRMGEMESGLKEYGEQFGALKPYAEQARQNGTDLKTIIDRFIGAQNTLKNDPAQAFQQLGQNMGFDPLDAAAQILIPDGDFQAAAMAMLAPDGDIAAAAWRMLAPDGNYSDVAWAMIDAIDAGKSPVAAAPAPAPTPAQPTEQPQAPQLPPEVQQALGRLQQYEQREAQQQQTSAAQKVIDNFKAQHPDFDALEADINWALSSLNIAGKTPQERLANAYETAKRFAASRPAPTSTAASQSAPAPATTPPTARTQVADLSLNGSPMNGSHPSHSRKPASTRDAVSNAFDLIYTN